MNTIIFIAGFPAVGKTTIAKELTHLLSPWSKNIDIDEIKHRVVDSEDLVHDIDADSVRKFYYTASIEHALYLFQENNTKYVVMEEVFHRRHLRKQINKQCKKANVRICWVYISCDSNTVENRLNKKPRIGHVLNTKQTLSFYYRFAEIFDMFHDNEECVQLDNNDGNTLNVAEKIIDLYTL